MLEKLKFRKSLSVLENENKLASEIVDAVKEKMLTIDLETLKYDSQFLLDICKCVTKNQKHMCYKKKWGIEKKNVIIKVFHLLYGENIELSRIETMIEFIEDNALLNKSLFKMAFDLLTRFF